MVTNFDILEKKRKAAERTALWRKKNHARALEATKKWVAENKERAEALKRRWYFANKERAAKNSAKWYAKNSKKAIEAARLWVEKNPSRRRKNVREWVRDLPPVSQTKIRMRLSTRIRMALGSEKKAYKTETLIGCSIQHFRAHIESQFKEGMTWENYGQWHIDHLVPCRAFRLSEEAQQLLCFNYTNLRPLWAVDNLKKGDRIEVNGVKVSARRICK
jgi:hypothetical protein